MKRKPPKNLRPYATPSGKKVVLIEVTGEERERLAHSSVVNDLGTPILYHTVNDGNKVWVEAGPLRKWRASQTTSEAADGS